MNAVGGERTERLAQLARTGHTEALVAELGSAADAAELCDHKGDSLLMLAAYHGHAEASQALLERGASLTARNARGLSALDGAAFRGDLPVLAVLIAAGADPNQAGADGRTPLMWAAAFERSTAVELLLRNGADPELRDGSGLRALEHAERMGGGLAAALLTRVQTAPVRGAPRTFAQR